MGKVLTMMTRKQYIGTWLRRVEDSPPTYEVVDLSATDPTRMISAFKRSLHRFVAELTSSPWQLSLFDAEREESHD